MLAKDLARNKCPTHVNNGDGVGDSTSEITPGPNRIGVRESEVTPSRQTCSFVTHERGRGGETGDRRQETSHPTCSLCVFRAVDGGPRSSVSSSMKWA